MGASFEQPVGAGHITGLGVTRVLEAIRQTNPKIRFYQASTSELFGNADLESQTEDTPFRPASPYAAAKLYAYWITKIYREGYGLFACNGILFNHEAPLRGLGFVTRKISNAVAQIALGLKTELRLGNLAARRDWGFAPEYVESMWLMLQQNAPGDYVIATNETHSVQEFADKAFQVVGLDSKRHVIVDKRYLRPIDVNWLQGDYSKAAGALNWKPRVTLDKLVEIMVTEDLGRWERWGKGERFPWDAPNYPEETNILTRALRV